MIRILGACSDGWIDRGGIMEGSLGGEFRGREPNIESKNPEQDRDRRARPRSEGVMGRIEDITYAILRKHFDKPA
ncbi:MAG TPA: hypothetical protein VEI01_08195 [Terriglobales bacterium]|nr:hypothetical protein [Terriglobales bacterium]